MKVNCFKCKHFYITWDPQNPKGCRIYQFKSNTIPSVLVRTETGTECQSFEPKKENNDETIDLNDERYW